MMKDIGATCALQRATKFRRGQRSDGIPARGGEQTAFRVRALRENAPDRTHPCPGQALSSSRTLPSFLYIFRTRFALSEPFSEKRNEPTEDAKTRRIDEAHMPRHDRERTDADSAPDRTRRRDPAPPLFQGFGVQRGIHGRTGKGSRRTQPGPVRCCGKSRSRRGGQGNRRAARPRNLPEVARPAPSRNLPIPRTSRHGPGADRFRREAQPRRPCPGAGPKRFGRSSGERSGRKRRARTDIAASNGLRQTAPTRNSAFLQIFLRRRLSDSRGRAGRKTGIFRHRRTHGSAQFASGTICPA